MGRVRLTGPGLNRGEVDGQRPVEQVRPFPEGDLHRQHRHGDHQVRHVHDVSGHRQVEQAGQVQEDAAEGGEANIQLL